MIRQWSVLLLLLILWAGIAIVACDDDDDNDEDNDENDGNGDDIWPTWIDENTGITWEVLPQNHTVDWEEAIDYCESLETDGGGWRLPTISELRSLIRGCEKTELGGSCGVTDECTDYDCWSATACERCGYLDGPADGGAYWPDEIAGEINWYWSASVVESDDRPAWRVSFDNGEIDDTNINESSGMSARCVR